jgi:O-acetyl-ADP-ribose deacetylase (regulator of RNase III)
MTEIRYIKGDATSPQSEGNKIIVHVCNDVGGWGKGFVMAISKKWPAPEKKYREWYQSKENFALGEIELVPVEENIWVANVIGQRNINKDEFGNPPVRYDAIENGLYKVAVFAKHNNASVHMPRIGCGLAGGKWENMELIIIKALSQKNIQVTVYDFG